jgi:hypothetical protein
MPRSSTMRAGQPSTVVLDPQAAVSRHIARRVRKLIGQVRVWSIDGQDIRERRDLLAAGRRFPRPRLVRGTVGTHRLELSTDDHGRALGRCDCRAAGFGLVCSHLLALAVHAVTLGWEAA